MTTSVTELKHSTHVPIVAQFSPQQTELLHQAFPGLDAASLASLASMTRERTIAPGATLCTEGQVEDTFYLICSGRVLVSQQLERDTSRILAYRGAGDFIGELSLLIEGQPRTADVMTLQETTVLEIERAAFLELLQRSPSVVLAVLRVLAARQRESDQKTIGDLRQKYEELAETYRRLKDETSRRSEFLTTVAHELRTPLTVIKGYLMLLRMGAFSKEALAEAIRTVKVNLDTFTRLINNILLLQEIALIKPQFQTVSIGSLIGDLVNTSTALSSFPANLNIWVELANNLPTIQADPAGLSHALGAILDNAVKFSPDGGEIVVRAYADDSKISIQVNDPGIGIAPEELPNIFNHFHHLDTTGAQMFGGIGLGLPLAKAVIEQHCGAIHIESEPGKGSTFAITLPLAGCQRAGG